MIFPEFDSYVNGVLNSNDIRKKCVFNLFQFGCYFSCSNQSEYFEIINTKVIGNKNHATELIAKINPDDMKIIFETCIDKSFVNKKSGIKFKDVVENSKNTFDFFDNLFVSQFFRIYFNRKSNKTIKPIDFDLN